METIPDISIITLTKNDLEGLIIFLSSNASNYITGSIIPLDGGLHVSTGSELFSEAKS